MKILLTLSLTKTMDSLKTSNRWKGSKKAPRILFNSSVRKDEKHTIPVCDVVNRLEPEYSGGLLDNYSEIDQAKGAKNDDTKADGE